MKRIAIAMTAVVAVLVLAGTALAAIDTYTSSYSFNGSAGSAKQPAQLSFTQKFDIKATLAGGRSGILNSIKTTISGAKVDVTGVPVCSFAKISAASNDAACPKGALIATGSLKASLGPASPFTAATGAACDPALDVWNDGKGKLVFFFTTNETTHQCLGGQVHTGATPPFVATYKQQGSTLAVDIPIPNTVTHIGPLVASVSEESLTWHSVKHGSSYDIQSTGCKGKRAFTFTFAASTPTGQSETVTNKGSASCG